MSAEAVTIRTTPESELALLVKTAAAAHEPVFVDAEALKAYIKDRWRSSSRSPGIYEISGTSSV